MERPVPFISRVRLRNFKSIAECDVTLGPLTVLIGPNGSGKSNFLQALRLLGRAVTTTPLEAVTELGGLEDVVRRIPEPADSFSIDVEMSVPWGPRRDQRASAEYGFEIGFPARRGVRPLEVLRETCALRWGSEEWGFSVHRGAVHDPVRGIEPGRSEGIAPDRLYLLLASVQLFYAPLLAALSGMRFYSFSPDVLRAPARPSEGAVLDYHGQHLGDVIGALAAADPGLKQRVDAYLGAVVPGIERAEPLSFGGYMTVAFRASPGHAGDSAEFGTAAISDGTIRAAAVLAALFQPAATGGRIPLVGIEGPEIALHPAAARVLFDALTEASGHVQVIVTSQSPDLLDRDDLDLSAVRAVSMRDGVTAIGDIDQASRRIVKDKLYTLGELMRSSQISPEQAGDAQAGPGA
jgi:predicted ATPase